MGFIYIISFDYPYKRVLLAAAKNIKEMFRLEVRISEASLKTIKPTFNLKRHQYHGGAILEILKRYKFPNMEKLIGILNVDVYEENLNFIFGEAIKDGKYALVSSFRLYTEEEILFIERVCKEVNHELGHSFGLDHCNVPKCVMNFSNSVYEVDKKSRYFCSRCSAKIERYIIN